ncbi:MAG: LytTR family transcriptional regulator, partial [Gammaproteobacteria bacterium]|nr:LytTR family transcriptional regulator [Gammaproteobacteria bacterium]
MMALPLGWYGAGLASELPFAASMILWTSICLVSWWLSDLLARLLARWFSAWSPAPWSMLIGGYMLNLLASSTYNPWVVEFLLRAGLATPTPMLEAYFEIERSLLDPTYLWLLTLAGLPGLLCWLAGNFALEAVCGVPRFRSTAGRQSRRPIALGTHPVTIADPAEPAPEPPRFLQRLQQLEQIGIDELIAVEAADHYIQVHTTRGKELVHYRFGDALAELEPHAGLQIHRSAWVSDHGVSRLAVSGNTMSAVLITGERLAVSQPNRRIAKARFAPRKR